MSTLLCFSSLTLSGVNGDENGLSEMRDAFCFLLAASNQLLNCDWKTCCCHHFLSHSLGHIECLENNVGNSSSSSSLIATQLFSALLLCVSALVTGGWLADFSGQPKGN